jgi:hypothetical protein
MSQYEKLIEHFNVETGRKMGTWEDYIKSDLKGTLTV